VRKNSSPFWQLVAREHENARAYCLKQVDSFRPWFYQIINNTYKGRFRNPWWKHVLSRPTEIADQDWNHDPTDFYEAKRRLESALSALSVDDRIFVTLAELEGWKISELAELTSKTEGFIKMRLSRARTKMRKRLGDLHRRTTRRIRDRGTVNICCATEPEED
jgi:RNA polymerase sigma factor (sigma-70 family)